jgi:hypothetical protein
LKTEDQEQQDAERDDNGCFSHYNHLLPILECAIHFVVNAR